MKKKGIEKTLLECVMEIENLKKEKHELEYKMQGMRNVLYDCFMTLLMNGIIKHSDKFYNDIQKAMN